MLHEFVSIDLETTGFDAMRDEIIEIGAVHFRDGVIVNEIGILVDPHRPIPPVITQLTGIRDEDLLGAAQLSDALKMLSSFTGDLPVVAHNISFDIGFLHQRKALLNNPRIDTYELASVLVPGAPRYNVGSLALQFDIPLEAAHRALDDARATAHIYAALWNLLADIPTNILLEILDIGRDLPWDGRYTFLEALQMRGITPTSEYERFNGFEASVVTEDTDPVPSAPISMNADTVTSFFGAQGPLAQGIEQYEDRPQQREMAMAVQTAFDQSTSILIEAGTGTGKSMAYLVPAIFWSLENGRRVIVSTQTINLQEQLLFNDIPVLQQIIDVPFSAALLKGRGNYLCPRRLDGVRRRRASSADELRLVAKILVWHSQSQSGDRGELTLRGGEYSHWSRVSAEDQACGDHICRSRMHGVCPFYKAHQAAESANLVVVNHALLVADAVAQTNVIPPYTRVIIDEAHQFEDAVTTGLSVQLDAFALNRHISEIGSIEPARGLLGTLAIYLRGSGAEQLKLKDHAATIGDAIPSMNVHAEALFRALLNIVKEHSGGSDYTPSIRIVSAIRDKLNFAQAAEAFSRLEEYFDVIAVALTDLATALVRREISAAQEFQDAINAILSEAHYLTDTRNWLRSVFFEPEANAVYWISTFMNGEQAGLHSAPIDVSQIVNESIISRADTVVMTSATLQVSASFDYVRTRLGCDDVDTLDVGSPFNYHDSTLLYLPTDLPDPSNKVKHQAAVEQAIIHLASALKGRTLVLFTSYAQLKQTAAVITPRLRLGGITVYDQSEGSSRQALVSGFKTAEKAVLLGTRSFWEGVDIPGESLSGLVIVKLPFSVPTDPIVAARSERYDDAFREYSVPDAVLRFRQGFGRLIRTKRDRGIVVILDNRVLTKGYGRHFLESLPDCTVIKAPLSDLPESALEWLHLTRS